MDKFTNERTENCISKEQATQTSEREYKPSSIPSTSGYSSIAPVAKGSLPATKKQTKRRPIDGLHLGSLPQAPMADNSKPQFANQAFNPFFLNIRQNTELSPTGIKERFPVRFPEGMKYDPETGSAKLNGKYQTLRYCVGMRNNNTLPPWLQRCLEPDMGQTLMARCYEVCLHEHVRTSAQLNFDNFAYSILKIPSKRD